MRSAATHTTTSALKALLDLHGLESKGSSILQAMEAPYLFLHRSGRYIAGASFLTPDWLNNYLLPLGYRLTTHQVNRLEVRTFLASHAPAALELAPQSAFVVSCIENNRVCLVLPGTADIHQQAFPTLLRKLPESVTAFTLESCPPVSIDAIPLLCESVRTLSAYRRELTDHLARTVTRQDMQTLHQTFFRALMVDMPAIAHLYTDMDVSLHLHELAHIYRHLFIIGENEVCLRERLPAGMINRCILWLQELIIDRLHALGASDDVLEPLYHETY